VQSPLDSPTRDDFLGGSKKASQRLASLCPLRLGGEFFSVFSVVISLGGESTPMRVHGRRSVESTTNRAT